MAVLMVWLAHSVSPMIPPPTPMAAWRIAVAALLGCVLVTLTAYLARARTYVLTRGELQVRPWWAKKPGVGHALDEMRSVGLLAAGILRVPVLEVEFRSGSHLIGLARGWWRRLSI